MVGQFFISGLSRGYLPFFIGFTGLFSFRRLSLFVPVLGFPPMIATSFLFLEAVSSQIFYSSFHNCMSHFLAIQVHSNIRITLSPLQGGIPSGVSRAFQPYINGLGQVANSRAD